MTTSFAAPRTIRRIAARRVFQSSNGKSVVLTIGVPQRVPGSDWGCAIQITGLNDGWSRPRYVFGIAGLQALHLGMKCAAAVLQTTDVELEWLGVKGDFGMPKFIPYLPKPHQDRLEARIEREATKFWSRVIRVQKAKALKRKKAAGKTQKSK